MFSPKPDLGHMPISIGECPIPVFPVAIVVHNTISCEILAGPLQLVILGLVDELVVKRRLQDVKQHAVHLLYIIRRVSPLRI